MQILHVREAKTLTDKTRGLLGTTKPYPLLLKTHWGIHTFGMHYPIDVVILDKKNKIVAGKEALKPNRIFLWNPQYDTVLELPIGTIKKYHLSVGTIIKVEKVQID